MAACAAGIGIERFQAKWKPVRVKKTRQIKNLEPRFDSIETEKALAAARASTNFVIPGCANRTRVYPSSAISLSKSATAGLDGAGPESIRQIVVMGSGFALRAPRNDEATVSPPTPDPA